MLQVRNTSAQIKQEGSASGVNEHTVFYFQQRGIEFQKAVQTILTGFCSDILRELPCEFEEEVKVMVDLKIEESTRS